MSTLTKFGKWMVVGVLLTLFGCASDDASHCESGVDEELSTEESIDKFFGDYVVTPMYTVMFYDLVFWDNYHPAGHFPAEVDTSKLDSDARKAATDAAVNATGPTLRDYDAEQKTYVYGCRMATTRDAVTPEVPEGLTRSFGPVTVALHSVDGKLNGDVQAGPIDLAKYGLVADEEATEPRPQLVNLPELAPFPVRVDLASSQILPETVELPWSLLDIGPNSKVRIGDADAVVAAMDRRKVNVWTSETWTDSGALVRSDTEQIVLPAVVFWLVLGAFFFTFRFAFINIRAFFHAIQVTAGKFDDPGEPGEVTHFQALSSALSATVGLGNIAGVAIAVTMGGPGALFWMVVAGFLGMSSKFTECTLGQMYRKVRPDGTVSGGPMHYLSEGLSEMKLAPLGRVLAILFALMCIGGSLGGGNMFQGNQSFQAIADIVPSLMPSAEGTVEFTRRDGVEGAIEIPAGATLKSKKASFEIVEAVTIPAGQQTISDVAIRAKTKGWDGNVDAGNINQIKNEGDLVTVNNPTATAGGASKGIWFGLIMMVAVGLVIIGGIKRIGAAAGVIVPAMCGVYVLAGLYILLVNASEVPGAFLIIFQEALTPEAGFGGVVGALIMGFRRASFSNEAGIGSASIAHSAAATSEPVREGIVALLEPFIDTIIVCTMTGLVVVATGVYKSGEQDGISLTSTAFEQGGLSWFPYVLAVAVTLFAFSTMISWSYYGERAATWLLGEWVRVPYKVLFLLCAALGPVFTLGNVLGFSDLMVLGMAFPNILGLILLSKKVNGALKTYMEKLKAGKFHSKAA